MSATTSKTPQDTSIAALVHEQRDRVFQVMAVLSTIEGCLQEQMCDVRPGEPDIGRAVQATYDLLNDICAKLDPTYVHEAIAADMAGDAS